MILSAVTQGIERVLPEMCSTVNRYVETRRDHLRSFGARFFAVDNH